MPRMQVVLDALRSDEEDAVLVHTRKRLTRERYHAFCLANPDLRIELTASGEIIVMPPAHSRTGEQNAEITYQLTHWARYDGTGIAFDSSTGFDLPNGSNRAPDAAWVPKRRIAGLSEEEREGYLPLCPDFVIELRSRSDSLRSLKDKMQEYIDNGARLGWLIDPLTNQVFIFRPGQPPERGNRPETLSGEEVLPGFTLELARIWNPEV